MSEHDLRANAFRVCCKGEPVPTFPDHALGLRDPPRVSLQTPIGSFCPTGNARMSVMRKLPVVLICRMRMALPETPNQLHIRSVPPRLRGALRDRHERWVRDAVDVVARETNVASADGKAVWS